MAFALARACVVLLILSAVSACAPHVTKPADPPPLGPFRTTAGEPTHPRCLSPGRRAETGASPRCVVSFGRGTTAVTAAPDGSQLLMAVLDVDPTTWRLPAVEFG